MILVICEQESLKKLTVTNLKKWGFNVCSFDSGREALTFLHRFSMPVDAVVVDSDLPYFHVEEFLPTLRETTTVGANTPILVIHTSDDPHDISKAYEAGATKVITKPFGMGELQEFTAQAGLVTASLNSA